MHLYKALALLRNSPLPPSQIIPPGCHSPSPESATAAAIFLRLPATEKVLPPLFFFFQVPLFRRISLSSCLTFYRRETANPCSTRRSSLPPCSVRTPQMFLNAIEHATTSFVFPVTLLISSWPRPSPIMSEASRTSTTRTRRSHRHGIYTPPTPGAFRGTTVDVIKLVMELRVFWTSSRDRRTTGNVGTINHRTPAPLSAPSPTT